MYRFSVSLGLILGNGGQHGGGLLAAHHRNSRVRPRVHEPGAVGATAHAIVSRAIRPTDDNRELGHLGRGDRRHHLGAVLGYAARLELAAHHETGDVLQEEERYLALGAQLDKVSRLERRLGEQHAVVGYDADRVAVEAREARDQRLAVHLLELVEAAAVDEASDYFAHVKALHQILAHDAVDLVRRVQGLLNSRSTNL